MPVTNLTTLGEFLRVFAYQCHHGKEEASLFPVLEALGVPATGCPLGGLIGEHQKGRLLVGDLMQAAATYGGDANAAREQVAVSLRALSQLYKNHIWKEDNLLFPLAEKLLPTAEAESLLGAFRRVEQEIGVKRLSELAEFVAELERS